MAVPESIVLDASAALDWFDPAGRGSYSESLRIAIYDKAVQPVAPFHFEYECAAVLTRWYRSKKITRALLDSAANQLAVLQMQLQAIPANTADLVALALKYRLTPFDAMYIHVAATEGAASATLDGGLIEACKSHKIKHWQTAGKVNSRS